MSGNGFIRFVDSEIYRIEEYEGLGFPPKMFLPSWSDDDISKHLSWMVPGHFAPDGGRLRGSIHSWLIKTSGLNILVDACSGNGKSRPSTPFFSMLETPFLENLNRAGVTPDDIDFVLCTHLHVDHVGWNTRFLNGRWVPTFPNAKYIVSKRELTLLTDLEPDVDDNALIIEDTIRPLIESGLLFAIDPPFSITERLSVESAPGHTPGHVVLRLQYAEGSAIFVGDVLHHPIQIVYPDWNSHACREPVDAISTRRKLLEECSETASLLLPVHFAAPYCCKVGRPVGSGFECILND